MFIQMQIYWCSVVLLAELIVKCVLQPVSSSSNFDLDISPRNAHISPNSSLYIKCTATDHLSREPVPLGDCQFKELFNNSPLEVFQSSNTSSLSAAFMTDGNRGECGVRSSTHSLDTNTFKIIGCRVRSANGTWKYATMVLLINAGEVNVKYEFHDLKVITAAGSNAVIKGIADKRLKSCYFSPPIVNKTGNIEWISLGKGTSNSTAYRYVGSGLDEAQCGIEIFDVTPAMSGFVVGQASASSEDYNVDIATLIVSTPPDTPVLIVRKDSYVEGETLEATCTASNSRPVAILKWFLDDAILRHDTIDDSPLESRWRWSFETQSTMQNLTKPLTWLDNGKRLRCEAKHMALRDGKTLSSQGFVLKVEYYPRFISNDKIYTTSEIIIEVLIAASPQPSVTWEIGGVSISEEEENVNVSANLQAVQSIMKVGDNYLAKLVTPRVSSDSMINITINAENKHGKLTETLKIEDKEIWETFIYIGIACFFVIISIVALFRLLRYRRSWPYNNPGQTNATDEVYDNVNFEERRQPITASLTRTNNTPSHTCKSKCTPVFYYFVDSLRQPTYNTVSTRHAAN